MKKLLIFCSLEEAYLEYSQTTKMEMFAKIVNGFQPLTILTKISVIGV